MKNRYILAVDGGGTKTHYCLVNLDTSEVDTYKKGTTSHERLKGSFVELEMVIKTHIREILSEKKIEMSDIIYSCFGLAGMDLPYQFDIMRGILDRAGYKNYDLLNDSFLPIFAMSESGSGVCAINGTGFSVGGIDDHDKTAQAGGFFNMSDDFGGGVWYTEQAVSAVYGEIIGTKKHTELKEYIFNELKIRDSADFLSVIYQLMDKNPEQLRLVCSKAVHKCADAGDASAIEILEVSGKEYAKKIRSVIDRLHYSDERIEIILNGSQFSKGSSVLTDALKRELSSQYRISICNRIPVIGAVKRALSKTGYEYTDVIDRNILEFEQ